MPEPADLAAAADLRVTAPSWPRRRPRRSDVVADLTAHGRAAPPGRVRHFDDEPDLGVARPRPGLAAYGVEPRHLRPFRTAADREVGLVEQVVRAGGRTGRGRRTAPPPRCAACASPCTPRWCAGTAERRPAVLTSRAR